MVWMQLTPANAGGGRKRGPVGGKFYANGQLAFSAKAYDDLGEPDRVLVWFTGTAIKVSPTTASDNGGYTVVGGGGAPYRITTKVLVKKTPQLLGELQGEMVGGALYLWRKDDDRPDLSVPWATLRPSTTTAGRTQARADAYIYQDGRVRLSARVATEIGHAGVLVWVDLDTDRLLLKPASSHNEMAFTLSGQKGTEARFSLSKLIRGNRHLVGRYQASKTAQGVLLIKHEQTEQ